MAPRFHSIHVRAEAATNCTAGTEGTTVEPKTHVSASVCVCTGLVVKSTYVASSERPPLELLRVHNCGPYMFRPLVHLEKLLQQSCQDISRNDMHMGTGAPAELNTHEPASVHVVQKQANASSARTWCSSRPTCMSWWPLPWQVCGEAPQMLKGPDAAANKHEPGADAVEVIPSTYRNAVHSRHTQLFPGWFS